VFIPFSLYGLYTLKIASSIGRDSTESIKYHLGVKLNERCIISNRVSIFLKQKTYLYVKAYCCSIGEYQVRVSKDRHLSTV
jgi:hypothetical protein